MRLITARVTKVYPVQHGAQRLVVETEGPPSLRFEALRYEVLVAPCELKDMVLINTTAVDLGLGTGGMCPVLANLTAIERSGQVAFDDSVPSEGPAFITAFDTAFASGALPAGGHIMKLRYTPFQHEVFSVEEPASSHHAIMEHACSLEGVPVVCCELHSQMPLVAAAVKHIKPRAKLVYCMTDEAALLASFSAVLAQARASGLLDACITCGQALGGDLEAVNLYSGLLVATMIREADVIICAQGPGIVGTATRFGHGGLAQAQALNAVAALKGVPIAPLRLSFAEKRERHQGVSHHTRTALGIACLTEALIPVPDDLSAEQMATVEQQLEEAKISERHRLINIPVARQDIDLCGLEVTTMGRAQADDPAFFSAAFAAGIFAARVIGDREGRR
ncbi:MAG: DUF3866 family protein [Coriobacteriales bacterium]|jgi:hypothetical protein|nr:DUF3866 family protein [Coriobacteriales bacterium]